MRRRRPGGTQERRAALFREVFDREGGRCRWCGRTVRRTPRRGRHARPDAATLDHLVPRSRGGPLTPENLVLACYPCNNERGDTPAEDWARAVRDEPRDGG